MERQIIFRLRPAKENDVAARDYITINAVSMKHLRKEVNKVKKYGIQIVHQLLCSGHILELSPGDRLYAQLSFLILPLPGECAFWAHLSAVTVSALYYRLLHDGILTKCIWKVANH